MNRFFFLGAGAGIFLSIASYGAPESTQEGPVAPCAVLQKFGGDVQILDSSRTHLAVTNKKVGVPCGGWVSIGKGWAELEHRDGQVIHVGPQTFAQFTENNSDGKFSGDHIVLFKGEVYGQAGSGSGELRVLTANARARVKRGSMIVVFSGSEEETQMMCLEDKASLENRFQTAAAITIKAGEASSLNLKLMRVVPSAGRAIAVAALKPYLGNLHLGEKEQSYAIQAAHHRNERSLPTQVTETPVATSKRKIASTEVSDYSRHKADKINAKLNAYWAKKMAGGADVGEQILHPDQLNGRPRRVSVGVTEPSDKAGGLYQKGEEQEKKKLIEELSQIHIE